MAVAIYSLCAFVAASCTYLLLRTYSRSRHRLVLWSGVCFAGLTLNNIVLILDKIVFPETDLAIWRTSIALASMLVLLYGLIWETDT